MDDELIMQAIEIAKDNRDNFSLSLLQKKLKIGCIKCSKLIDILENKRVISSYDFQNNKRKVLI